MIIAAWLEDTQTLNVQFDQPVTVTLGANVGTWIVHDTVEGVIVPTEIIQIDVDVIWLITSKDMTSGTAGYTAGNPGGLSAAHGFPASDEHSY